MLSVFDRMILALALAILTGCATHAPSPSAGIEPPPKPVPSIAPGKAASLLYYFNQLLAMPAAELAKETERARKLYTSEKSDFNLLQYALALAVPGADSRHAQQLLETLVKENSGHDREMRALAILIYTDLVERRRLESNMQTLTRRAEDAESKLNALKAIETNMMQQEHPPGDKR